MSRWSFIDETDFKLVRHRQTAGAHLRSGTFGRASEVPVRTLKWLLQSVHQHGIIL